jgi:hypothetical protein
MSEIPRPILQGRKALVVGVANRHSIAYGCAKAFRELGAELAIRVRRTDRWRSRRTDLRPARRLRARHARSRVRDDREAMGRARHPRPFDRAGAEERPQGKADRLLHRRLPVGDGRLVPLVRPHGEPRGTVDEERRDAVRDELLRRNQGRAELQHDRGREGGARSLLPLPRLRGGWQGHPGARDLARAAQDARGIGSQGLRPPAERGCAACPDRRARLSRRHQTSICSSK